MEQEVWKLFESAIDGHQGLIKAKIESNKYFSTVKFANNHKEVFERKSDIYIHTGSALELMEEMPTKDEFNEIIQLAKTAGVYDQFRKGVTLSCNNCGAFVVKASALLTMLEHLMNFIDSNDISRSLTDDQQDLYDILCQKREMVVKTVILTDDEWSQYFSHGLSDYQFLCDDKGELITDTEGNPRVLVSADVVFEFDKQCECRNILSRLT